jgi:hypothetical protein
MLFVIEYFSGDGGGLIVIIVLGFILGSLILNFHIGFMDSCFLVGFLF